MHLESSGRGRKVESLHDRYKPDPVVCQLPKVGDCVAQAPAEPIQLVDQQDVKKASLSILHHLLELWTPN